MANNHLTSIFIEPRLTLLKSFYLSGGVRFDQSSIYDQVLTPRAGLTYNFKANSLRFSFANAFRAPKPWDYTDGLGNPSLMPEKMKSLETAFSFSVIDNLKIDLIGYKNNLENAITREVTNQGFRWINNGQIKTNGIEIYLRYASPKLMSSFNYTFNQSKDELGKPITEISKHSGNASATYSFTEHLKMNLRANYTGERENPKTIVSTNSQYINPSLIFHGALSFFNYKGFDIQILVKNILNTEYYHTSNRVTERYRQPQRTVMLSVSYTLND